MVTHDDMERALAAIKVAIGQFFSVNLIRFNTAEVARRAGYRNPQSNAPRLVFQNLREAGILLNRGQGALSLTRLGRQMLELPDQIATNLARQSALIDLILQDTPGLPSRATTTIVFNRLRHGGPESRRDLAALTEYVAPDSTNFRALLTRMIALNIIRNARRGYVIMVDANICFPEN